MAGTRPRLQLPKLGEYYDDLLTIDAWICGRTKAAQGQALLYSTLLEREQLMKEKIDYLAKKRGVSPDELWKGILLGEAEELGPGEIPERED